MGETYYLYLDDTGVRDPQKKQPPRGDGMDHFALGGVLVADSARGAVVAAHKKLCDKWGISYPLHSTDIRGRRYDFKWLRDQQKYVAFFQDLDEFLCEVPVIGLAAVVDRPGYNKRYQQKYATSQWMICKTAFSILVERAAKYADKQGSNLKIRFEQCGLAEDRAIMEYFKDLKNSGMPFDEGTSAKYGSLKAEDFRRILKGAPKRRTKSSQITQLADLYLYPMAKGGYDKDFKPYKMLLEKGKLMDSLLLSEEIPSSGIKYSCFDGKIGNMKI